MSTALETGLLGDADTDLASLRQSVRRFVDDDVVQHELTVEAEGTLPAETWQRLERRARDLGVWALNYPVDAGGPGMGALAQAVVREEMGRTTMGLSRLARRPPLALLRAGDHAREVAAAAVAGTAEVSFAMTESGAGSSLHRSRTRFTTTGPARRLHGEKHFVTGAPTASHLLVVAKDGDSGFTAALVPTDRAGVTVHPRPKMGWHGWPRADVTLDDVEVGEHELLGAPGDGVRVAMADIEMTRLGVSAHYVGTTHRALELAAATAGTREVSGGLLAHQQGFRWRVAELTARMLAAHELVMAVAATIDAAGSAPAYRISSLKWLASELAHEAADFALQTSGATGYQTDTIENVLFRDSRAFRIGEGTSEMQLETVARATMGAAR